MTVSSNLCGIAPTPVRVQEVQSSSRGIVQAVNPAEQSGWDSLVMAHPDCSFFHSRAWAKVLQETYDHTPLYFTLVEDNHLQALLPVMELNSWLTGRRGVSLPFSDHCEPLAVETANIQKCINEAIRYGKIRSWKFLECRGGRPFFPKAQASISFYGHTLELCEHEERLFAGLNSSTRRAVRKAAKACLTVEFVQTLDAVGTFYSLHCGTRRKHGLPPQPFSFFRSIHKHILSQGNGFIVVARSQQIPIAAAIFFHFGTKVIYKYGASDHNFQHLRATDLVMWDAIKWSAQNGFRELDLGRTPLLNEGLRRFKLGWGARERRIDYIKYGLVEQRFLSGKDQSRGWHNCLLRALPIFVGRMIGTLFYRHMA